MYQPKYPLRFSELDGAYDSIKDLKSTVKQNVLTLLNVSPGEWPGSPELGIGIRYLPFLDVRSHFVDKDEYGTDLIDSNEIKLVIKYNITPIAEQDLLTLTLGENVQ